jgi:hypothetical protein
MKKFELLQAQQTEIRHTTSSRLHELLLLLLCLLVVAHHKGVDFGCERLGVVQTRRRIQDPESGFWGSRLQPQAGANRLGKG